MILFNTNISNYKPYIELIKHYQLIFKIIKDEF